MRKAKPPDAEALIRQALEDVGIKFVEQSSTPDSNYSGADFIIDGRPVWYHNGELYFDDSIRKEVVHEDDEVEVFVHVDTIKHKIAGPFFITIKGKE